MFYKKVSCKKKAVLFISEPPVRIALPGTKKGKGEVDVYLCFTVINNVMLICQGGEDLQDSIPETLKKPIYIIWRKKTFPSTLELSLHI